MHAAQYQIQSRYATNKRLRELQLIRLKFAQRARASFGLYLYTPIPGRVNMMIDFTENTQVVALY